MPTYTKHSSSDESRVITVVVGSLLACIALGYALNTFLHARNDREIKEAQTEVYQQYLRNTPDTPATPGPASQALAERLRVRDQLLAHPAVKPGPGFAQPGVQSTGKVIIDALDAVQGRALAPAID